MSFLLDEEKTWIQRDFGLDRRLVKGLSKLGFIYPTLVQSKCIPIALQGKDVLVRARTGSGKTVAFSLPLLHKLLSQKEAEQDDSPRVRCLILAPTKELCKQIEKNVSDLIYYCRESVSLCGLSDESATVQQYRLQRKPDIVIATPARIAQQIRSGFLDLSFVKSLVIDEADLVLSFGYADDVNFIMTKMPKIFQGLLMSATLSPDLEKFKKVVLHNPAVLKLEETAAVGHLLQFYLESPEQDKFLTLYVFIKLGLLQGKGLIFVNDVNKCYKLKLFLQQFFISAAVLNAELPLNSRVHILEEFNRGVFDYLIATDASIDNGEKDDAESSENEANEGDDVDDILDGSEEEGEADGDGEDFDAVVGDSDSEDDGGDLIDEGDDGSDDEEEDVPSNDDDDDEGVQKRDGGGSKKDKKLAAEARTSSTKRKKDSTEDVEDSDMDLDNKGKSGREADYGVSRGIDFQGVNFVINFDFPRTSAAYTHRIGRTARGGASGTALSFVTVNPVGMKAVNGLKAKELEVAVRDARVLRQVQSQQPRLGAVEGDNVLAAIGSAEEIGSYTEAKMQPAPLIFNMTELDSFRYRVEDTLRAVTGVAVKEYRAAEIKREILNSAKLRNYFSENPNDLKVLRHDKSVAHPIKQKIHLKHVPQYLVPMSMRSVANTNGNKRKKRKGTHGQSQEQRILKSKARDPLQDPSTAAVSSSAGAAGAGAGDSEAGDTGRGDVADGHEKAQERLFSTNESFSLGRSVSGRRQWQERHKKGKFNAKNKKAGEHRTPGSFTKPKVYR